MMLHERLQANLAAINSRIQAACERCNRSAADVQLIAVTKYAPLEAVAALVQLGVFALGESRPQQLLTRAEQLEHVHWHLIGHLQRNKVRPILPHVELIHSVDSFRLAERISAIAVELGLKTRMLLEVNISGEAAKGGFEPDELRSSWQELQQLPSIQIDGLMTMAPLSDDPEEARPTFQGLRLLRNELQTNEYPLPHLSMGMSGDFEIAIDEGATLIRLGSVLFEGLE